MLDLPSGCQLTISRLWIIHKWCHSSRGEGGYYIMFTQYKVVIKTVIFMWQRGKGVQFWVKFMWCHEWIPSKQGFCYLKTTIKFTIYGENALWNIVLHPKFKASSNILLAGNTFGCLTYNFEELIKPSPHSSFRLEQ